MADKTDNHVNQNDRRDLEQLISIPDRLLAQATGVRLHFPYEACAYAVHADWGSQQRFLRCPYLPTHRLDVLVRQRMFPEMGKRLLD